MAVYLGPLWILTRVLICQYFTHACWHLTEWTPRLSYAMCSLCRRRVSLFQPLTAQDANIAEYTNTVSRPPYSSYRVRVRVAAAGCTIPHPLSTIPLRVPLCIIVALERLGSIAYATHHPFAPVCPIHYGHLHFVSTGQTLSACG